MFLTAPPRQPDLGPDRSILIDPAAGHLTTYTTPTSVVPAGLKPTRTLTDPTELADAAKHHLAAIESLALHHNETDYLQQVLRLAATGTPIITTGSPHLTDLIDHDLLHPVTTPTDTATTLEHLTNDPIARERTSIQLRRHVLAHHTTRHRFEELLTRLDIPTNPPERISIMLVTNRPDYLDHAYTNITNQNYPNLELITVLHGDTFDPTHAQDLNTTCPFPTTLIQAPTAWTLGDCLNTAIDAATGHYVTKMDDDDYYGPNHLTDLTLAHTYTNADIIGKRMNFVFIANIDLLAEWGAGHEETEVAHIPGATMLMERELALEFRFPRLSQAEDSDLLRRVTDAGGTLYSTHPFNFIRHRHGSHSFDRPDSFFLSDGTGLVWKDPDLSMAYV